MRWIVLLLACWFCLVTCGCEDPSYFIAPLVSETETDEITDPPGVLYCPGDCVKTPPATYTGPSLFWWGLPELVPACPVETPYQGLQGYLEDPKLPLFARECRITEIDLCEDQGQTCVPSPRPDYHVCIHHDDEEGGCPSNDEYIDQRTMFDVQVNKTVTLCCRDLGTP